MNFNKSLIKEISGIIFLFIIAFSIISLISYNSDDSSIFLNQENGNSTTENLFGIFGSNFAGILIYWFGLGAFWVPLLVVVLCIRFIREKISIFILFSIILGGILLIITSGSILLIKQNNYFIFNHSFPAGGLVSLTFKKLIIKYFNLTGGIITLSLMWVIGFIITTNLPLKTHYNYLKLIILFLVKKTKKFSVDNVKLNENTTNFNTQRMILPKKQIALPIGHENINSTVKNIFFNKIKKNTIKIKNLKNNYNLPGIDLLEKKEYNIISQAEINSIVKSQSELLNSKLIAFGIRGKIVNVNLGPIVTTFEYEPAAETKINKIINLSSDLGLALKTTSLRIIAPVSGKPVLGIEIPNNQKKIVKIKDIIVSQNFLNANNLTFCLGKSTDGEPISEVLEKMPHLLIAGATGTGKSVAINVMICSLLYKLTPRQVNMIMFDPKGVELLPYNGIPHLVTPVVTDAKEAINILSWLIQEMDNRYKLLAKKGFKNIFQYNNEIKKDGLHYDRHERMPYIVVIIDEFSTLMMVSSKNIENLLIRLSQMSRAAGIHLILATQRPSSDIITSTIKANFTARLAFKVSSKTDSRTIIDTNGAENLLGNGDMLFSSPITTRLQRIHGAYISEKEINNIIDFVKHQS